MRKLFVLFFILQSFILFGQDYQRVVETICITPYIPDEVQFPDNQLKKVLLDRLTQVVVQNGLASKGHDNRFVISANTHNVSESRTSTLPAKTALRLSVTFYVGDGKEGILFSSGNIELKGIGSGYEEAYRSALYKIRPNNPEIVQCLEVGKSRIMAYYDQIGKSVIQRAGSLIAVGNYDEAINLLFTIPMPCKHYQRAQEMIARYSEERIESYNKDLLLQAKAAWHADMSEDGAERAMSIMSAVQYPSKTISGQIDKFCAEVSSHLNTLSNQRWKIEMQQLQNRHHEEMAHIQSEKERSLAYIKAAESVAKTWANNQPDVVYRIYHWWY